MFSQQFKSFILRHLFYRRPKLCNFLQNWIIRDISLYFAHPNNLQCTYCSLSKYYSFTLHIFDSFTLYTTHSLSILLVLSLSIYYSFTLHILLIHSPYYYHSPYTIRSLSIYYSFTLHTTITLHILLVHSPYTTRSLSILLSLSIYYSFTLHILLVNFISYSFTLHILLRIGNTSLFSLLICNPCTHFLNTHSLFLHYSLTFHVLLTYFPIPYTTHSLLVV